MNKETTPSPSIPEIIQIAETDIVTGAEFWIPSVRGNRSSLKVVSIDNNYPFIVTIEGKRNSRFADNRHDLCGWLKNNNAIRIRPQ